MTNRQPPAHYNPPPMFGLRQPEDWPGEWIPGPPRSGRFTVIASDSFAPLSLYSIAAPVGFDHFRWPPLTSGTDAEP